MNLEYIIENLASRVDLYPNEDIVVHILNNIVIKYEGAANLEGKLPRFTIDPAPKDYVAQPLPEYIYSNESYSGEGKVSEYFVEMLIDGLTSRICLSEQDNNRASYFDKEFIEKQANVINRFDKHVQYNVKNTETPGNKINYGIYSDNYNKLGDPNLGW